MLVYNKDAAKATLIYKRTLIKAGPRLSKRFVDETLWESRLLGAIKAGTEAQLEPHSMDDAP
jgi:hypothetical protein